MSLFGRDPVTEPDQPNYGLNIGTITDNKDPEGLGRVRVRIPGLLEPASNWAWPLGMSGAGAKGKGHFNVPDVGAEVGVFFNQGNPANPWYMPGNWGADEVPEDTEGGNPQIRVMEFDQYKLVIDDRPESKSFAIFDKSGDAKIEFNGVTKQLSIESQTSIVIKSTGSIEMDALNIVLNGRAVLPTPEQI